MNKFIFTVVLSCISLYLTGQQFLWYKSKFTIKEKNTLLNNASITKGVITIDNTAKVIDFSISFPYMEHWTIKDSLMLKMRNDSIISSQSIGVFDQDAFYKELLNLHKTDYGLKDFGCTIKDIQSDDTKTYITWEPNPNFKKFMSKINTVVENNLLTAVLMYDQDGKEISTLFFSDHRMMEGTAFPGKILTRITGAKGTVLKSIEFSEVEVK